MAKPRKKPNYIQKPLRILWVISFVGLLIIGVIIFTIARSHLINSNRVTQIQETDKGLQKFGNLWEELFPSQVNREKYCRHDGVKLGKGALRCITRIGIETTYSSEDKLVNAIKKIDQSLGLASYLKFEHNALPAKKSSDEAANSGLIRFTDQSTNMLCSVDYAFVHFDSPAMDRRGEFNLSAHCATDALKKPIYELRD